MIQGHNDRTGVIAQQKPPAHNLKADRELLRANVFNFNFGKFVVQGEGTKMREKCLGCNLKPSTSLTRSRMPAKDFVLILFSQSCNGERFKRSIRSQTRKDG